MIFPLSLFWFPWRIQTTDGQVVAGHWVAENVRSIMETFPYLPGSLLTKLPKALCPILFLASIPFGREFGRGQKRASLFEVAVGRATASSRTNELRVEASFSAPAPTPILLLDQSSKTHEKPPPVTDDQK